MTNSRGNRNQTAAVSQKVSLRIIAIASLAATLHAAPNPDTVLANMDAAATAWTGMRARVETVRYMALVDDRIVESGRIAVRRSGPSAVELLLAIDDPYPYFFAIRDAVVERYKPMTKTVEEYDLSKARDKLENALLLGFGTAGSYLKEHYEISFESSDPVSAHPVVKLGLQPRNPAAETNNRPLEMWISTKTWQPVQQKVYDASPGDYRLQSYSEIELNPVFKRNEFKLNLKRGTKRVRPQF